MNEYLNVGLRSLCVYLFMVLGIRVFGKNQLSQLNAGDVVLLLLISNAVQNAMVGENTSLAGGLMAALVLFLANFLVKKLMFKVPKVQDFMEGEIAILIQNGKMDETAMKKAEISEEELEEAVREHGVEKPEDVKLAVLEVDGNISVVSFDDSDKKHVNYSRYKRKLKRHELQ